MTLILYYIILMVFLNKNKHKCFEKSVNNDLKTCVGLFLTKSCYMT